MKRPFYMDSTSAKEFGVVDKVSLNHRTLLDVLSDMQVALDTHSC